jgi:hypothetical protein
VRPQWLDRVGRSSGDAQPAPLSAVAWLEAFLSDLSVRSPHGIGWSVDRPDPPLEVRVSLATDGPVAELVLRDDGPAARIAVAEQVQLHVDADWDVALPPCPDHGTGLHAVRAGDQVRWRRPHGDVDCDIDDYDEVFWPPRPADADLTGLLLGWRLRRRGIRGMNGWNITGGVVRANVQEGTDESALRAAAAPLAVELK